MSHEAGGTVIEQGGVICCHVKGEKAWIDDPSGIAWETEPASACCAADERRA